MYEYHFILHPDYRDAMRHKVDTEQPPPFGQGLRPGETLSMEMSSLGYTGVGVLIGDADFDRLGAVKVMVDEPITKCDIEFLVNKEFPEDPGHPALKFTDIISLENSQ